MSDVDRVIGHCDWGGCETCVHSHPIEGGCDVPDEEWQADVDHMGEVHCLSYEPRQEPETPEERAARLRRPVPGQRALFAKET